MSLASTVEIMCESGYRFPDGSFNNQIQCVSEGNWSSAAGCVPIRKCPSEMSSLEKYNPGPDQLDSARPVPTRCSRRNISSSINLSKFCIGLCKTEINFEFYKFTNQKF